MEAPLRLRPSAELATEIAGYIIPSPDPEVWIEELLAWPEAGSQARLFLLPTSSTDLRPAAAFVTTPADVALSPRCRPYLLKADRLYLPADGRLDPDFGETELRKQLAGDRLLLHPTLGLVGFSESDALRFADLFQPPDSFAADWSKARPGVHIGKLRSIEPFPPPDVEMMFVEAGKDIGTDSPDALPSKKGGGVGGAVGKGIGAMFGVAGAGVRGIERVMDAIRNLFSGKPGKPMSESGRRWLGNWLEKKGQQFAGLQDRRNRAVEDLVEMLKRNPDHGLKYALPIAGAGGRGVARPGDQLTRRDVSFSLSGLFCGSGPVDEWHLNYDLQRKLNEEYHRLARREADLGRYRRAAYIYAHLLGDDTAAAAVLKEGKHFQEAAVLYERRLKNLREAAVCYEQAGSIEKAVELYRGQNDFIAAGDLLERVGRMDEASKEYEDAAGHFLLTYNYLRAAEILETKLHDPERAAAMLESAWPNRPQAIACAQKLFELAGRLGDDARAKKLLERIDQPTPHVPTHSRAQLMVEAFETHPSSVIRNDASRRVWKLLGLELSESGAAKQSLLELLPRLAPNDKLLQRDAKYFPKAKLSTRSRGRGELKYEVKIPITLESDWACVVTKGDEWYAIGESQSDLGNRLGGLYRGDWKRFLHGQGLGRTTSSGRTATLALTGVPELLILLDTPDSRNELFKNGRYPGHPIPLRFLTADKPFQALGVCNDETGRVWMLNGRHLHHYDARFQFKRSYLIDREEPFAEPPRMLAVGENVFISDGSSLYIHRNGSGASAPFPVIHSMAATTGFTEPMVAFGLDQGVAFGKANEPVSDFHVMLAPDKLDKPVVGFSRDGRLVASDGNLAIVYRPTASRWQEFEFNVGMQRAHTIAPTTALDEIALFAVDGTVRVYSLGP